MTMTPWDLVHAHRYEEAISAYQRCLLQKPNDSITLAGLGIALLCLQRLNESLGALEKASVINAKEVKGASAYLEDVATVQWLMGMKNEAKQTLRYAVDGILDGSITYADSAGGVSQGLLLWYASLTTKDIENRDYALAYLKGLAKRSRIKNFPGSVARYVLGEIELSIVLKEAADSEDLEACLEAGRTDLLKRRQLCRTLFYYSILARTRGEEQASKNIMRQCFSLENPVNEMEWYLARAECVKRK